MDSSTLLAFSLMILGLALIVAELFIPSGGVITFLSLACLVGAGLFAHRAWWDESPSNFWWFIGSLMGLAPLTAGGALWLLSRTRLGSRVFLEAPKWEEVSPFAQETEQRKQLIGRQGITLTLMSPGGLVLVDGKRFHAETEGLMLDPNEPVKIIAVKANRVVVRPCDPAETLADNPAALNKFAAADPTQPNPRESNPLPLEFEIPDS
mgnify:CR=1 FL=1